MPTPLCSVGSPRREFRPDEIPHGGHTDERELERPAIRALDEAVLAAVRCHPLRGVSMSVCVLCSHADSDTAEVYRDGWWAATVHPGLEVPGWFVLRLLRHAEGLAAMSVDEAAALGRALQRISAAVGAVCETDVVYATCFGEENRHLHLLVMARAHGIPVNQRRGRLAEQASRLADAHAADEVALRTRVVLEADRS